MGDSTVRCVTCGREESVDFATCLRLGWPKCHDATMRLETHPGPKGIDAAVGKAIRAQLPKRSRP